MPSPFEFSKSDKSCKSLGLKFPLNLSKSSCEGVITDKEPTFNTPLAPTTIPFGEINTTLPSERPPPALLRAFKIPLILI